MLNLDLTPGNVKNKALTKDIAHLLEGSGGQQLLSVCGHESLATLEQRLVIVSDVVSQSSRPLLLNGYRDSLIKTTTTSYNSINNIIMLSRVNTTTLRHNTSVVFKTTVVCFTKNLFNQALINSIINWQNRSIIIEFAFL